MTKKEIKTDTEIKRAVDKAIEAARDRRIAMEKKSLAGSVVRKNKRWQELGGDNLTKENFEEILRRASLPFASQPDQGKSETSG